MNYYSVHADNREDNKTNIGWKMVTSSLSFGVHERGMVYDQWGAIKDPSALT